MDSDFFPSASYCQLETRMCLEREGFLLELEQDLVRVRRNHYYVRPLGQLGCGGGHPGSTHHVPSVHSMFVPVSGLKIRMVHSAFVSKKEFPRKHVWLVIQEKENMQDTPYQTNWPCGPWENNHTDWVSWLAQEWCEDTLIVSSHFDWKSSPKKLCFWNQLPPVSKPEMFGMPKNLSKNASPCTWIRPGLCGQWKISPRQSLWFDWKHWLLEKFWKVEIRWKFIDKAKENSTALFRIQIKIEFEPYTPVFPGRGCTTLNTMATRFVCSSPNVESREKSVSIVLEAKLFNKATL